MTSVKRNHFTISATTNYFVFYLVFGIAIFL